MKVLNSFLNNIVVGVSANNQEQSKTSIFGSMKNENNDSYSADEIADMIFSQIKGITLSNKTTIEKLALINENNILTILSKYKKLSGNDLSNDILSEWSIVTKLDINTVKKYLCEPLVKAAQKVGLNPDGYEQLFKNDDITTYINNIAEDVNIIVNSKHSQSIVKDDIHLPFEKETLQQMSKNNSHITKLLDIAQDTLGLQEVTKEEFDTLSDSEKKKTQWLVMEGIDNAGVEQAWCAYTVSYLCKKAKVDIGETKSQVIQFINWAKDPNTTVSYKKIDEEYDIEIRKRHISDQLDHMKEGDFIIWKSKSLEKIDGINEPHFASHIGIIESVKNGVVTVIEGNANIISKEARVANTDEEAAFGNQTKGHEALEVNYRDGLIRKQYTVEELAKNGYSGYIDTQSIIK